jgi:hypothetical protein
VQLSWRVSNQGTRAAQGPWTDTVYLSTDALAGGDVLLGSFSLGATQQFAVLAHDVLSDFAVTRGTTNLMAGETNAVPIVLRSTLDLTNLAFTLTTADHDLTNLTLQSVSPEMVSSVLQPVGASRYSVTLALNPALVPAGTRDVARLGFTAAANGHSAIVPLKVSQVVGLRAGGQLVANPGAVHGQVIVVAREPVVTITHHSPVTLTLFGHPGAGCAVEQRTNLTAGTWQELTRLTLTNRITPLGVEAAALRVFYRSYEFDVTPPSLAIQRQAGPVFALTLSGRAGAQYIVQTATNLHAPVFWSNLFTATLTNSPQTFGLTNAGSPSRYFRALRP